MTEEHQTHDPTPGSRVVLSSVGRRDRGEVGRECVPGRYHGVVLVRAGSDSGVGVTGPTNKRSETVRRIVSESVFPETPSL